MFIAKTLSSAASTLKKVAGVADAEDDGDSGGLNAARAILEDHRLGLEPAPSFPKSICDSETFPYYPSLDSPSSQPNHDPARSEAIRVATYIKDHWISGEMTANEAVFTSDAHFTVQVGTYNCNGKKPDGLAIDAWVCAQEARGAPPCDICVFGFQEIVDLNVQNVASNALTKERSALWHQMIHRSLNGFCRRTGEEGYEPLDQPMRSLVGIMICAFVLKRRAKDVRNVQTAEAATGVMGMVGNKGACSIRFEFNDSSLCFVCAHLAAHADAVENRNSDYRQIMAKTSFKMDAQWAGKAIVPERHHSRIAATTHESILRRELFINEHDFVVWLGDFNYRIDASRSAEEVLGYVARRDVEWLYRNDQLRIEMDAGRVFQGLVEVGNVREFLPTYKFEPGTDAYDQRPEKKIRAPAWTDRILWRPKGQSKCLIYDKVDALKLSDHKPVEAALSVMGRVVNEHKRVEVYHQVLRRLDVGAGAAGVGPVSVEPVKVDFGKLVYRQRAGEQTVTLRNKSQAPVAWRFAARPGDDLVCAPWIRVSKAFGLLLPGEEAIIGIEAMLGMDVARTAVSERSVSDVLDLRLHSLEEGAQTSVRVAVNATLIPTCFGSHLAALAWAHQPIRVAGSGEVQFKDSGTSLNLPKELWRLVDALLASGLGEYRLFLMHADAVECALVREALDMGTALPKVSPYALAATLLELVDSLQEPVVPVDLVPDEGDLGSAEAEAKWAQEFPMLLPTLNCNVLGVLVGLVKELLKHSNDNHLDLDLLAPVFAEIVFRPSDAVEVMQENAAAQASAVGEFTTWAFGEKKGGDVKVDRGVAAAFAALCRG